MGYNSNSGKRACSIDMTNGSALWCTNYNSDWDSFSYDNALGIVYATRTAQGLLKFNESTGEFISLTDTSSYMNLYGYIVAVDATTGNVFLWGVQGGGTGATRNGSATKEPNRQ